MEKFKAALARLGKVIAELFETVTNFIKAAFVFYENAKARCAEGFNPCMTDCPVAYSCRMIRQRRMLA